MGSFIDEATLKEFSLRGLISLENVLSCLQQTRIKATSQGFHFTSKHSPGQHLAH